MKRVAKKANVSIATVSRVINNTGYVKEETRSIVLKAMEELNYTPNSIARGLRTKKTTTIGYIIPDLSNYFFTTVAKGAEKILKEKGFQLLVSNTNESVHSEIEQLKMFNSQMIRGLIIATSAVDYKEIAPYIPKNIPVVFIDREPRNNPHDLVGVKNFDGVYQAIEHLILKKHTEIGIITGIPSLSSSQERLNGYKKALSDYNIPVNEKYIQTGNSKYESGYQLAEVLQRKKVTALFIANNLMTIGAMTYFKENNIVIPDNIELIGFDDYEWASITNPPLTVVKQPSYDIGMKAANLLLDRINNYDGDKVLYEFTTQLVLRDSSK